MTGLSLATEFPAASRDEWLKRVDSVLKGADFKEKLISRLADGIDVEPLHGQVAGARAQRPSQSPWIVTQRVDHPDPARANAQALNDLENGATGLSLVAAGAATARGFGIDVSKLGRILDGVALHAISLRVEGPAASALADLIGSQPLDPERLAVSFGLKAPDQISRLVKQGFKGPFMEADGRSWHARGASEAQELGCVLGDAVGYLRKLEGLDDRTMARSVGIALSADQDAFATLAKFRAMRLLWRRILEASGLPQVPLSLHAETGMRMMAALDPHSNILRSCAAVFGAGLGGADSICVLPFSIAQGLPNDFARRVARNVQNLLIEESNLWRVADPASGSGYVEELTAAFATKAWSVFQQIERGTWPSPDASSARNRPAIGTSAYRLANEFPAEVEAVP